ncbi:V-set and immunoglobulin domain-containing protein 10-like, partial [Cynoglossus semilaevis]|uniref:V-set and immunoglobulin domain-containing protein 10-like n=1 Tax=Cynoglossus semilaevis TaxID=244447 RepID=UPI000D62EB08
KQLLCFPVFPEPPFPEGQPIATAVERDRITLTCSENMSVPPASTTWRKGLHQEVIMPGPKYILSEDGPVLTLTIVNSKEDEGFYFCRSENPLDITELEVYLTVKAASSTYTGVIIGVFIAALIVGTTIIIAKTVYNNRHRICLGNERSREEQRWRLRANGRLDLVESDDEQIFHDTVPRLPPLPNGNHTTLVQIHRLFSSRIYVY